MSDSKEATENGNPYRKEFNDTEDHFFEAEKNWKNSAKFGDLSAKEKELLKKQVQLAISSARASITQPADAEARRMLEINERLNNPQLSKIPPPLRVPLQNSGSADTSNEFAMNSFLENIEKRYARNMQSKRGNAGEVRAGNILNTIIAYYDYTREPQFASNAENFNENTHYRFKALTEHGISHDALLQVSTFVPCEDFLGALNAVRPKLVADTLSSICENIQLSARVQFKCLRLVENSDTFHVAFQMADQCNAFCVFVLRLAQNADDAETAIAAVAPKVPPDNDDEDESRKVYTDVSKFYAKCVGEIESAYAESIKTLEGARDSRVKIRFENDEKKVAHLYIISSSATLSSAFAEILDFYYTVRTK